MVGCGWRMWVIGDVPLGYIYCVSGKWSLSLLSDHHVSHFQPPHSSAMMVWLTWNPKVWLSMDWDLWKCEFPNDFSSLKLFLSGLLVIAMKKLTKTASDNKGTTSMRLKIHGGGWSQRRWLWYEDVAWDLDGWRRKGKVLKQEDHVLKAAFWKHTIFLLIEQVGSEERKPWEKEVSWQKMHDKA